MRATDAGTPPLHSDVKVTVTAGSTGNQKPVFGQQNYQAKVKENTEPGAYVLQVSATDPDGPNNLIKYSLDIGAKDNFVIDERSGAVSVSKDAILDIQENGELYTIQVQALDRGKPFGQSSEATISVQIEDVNDKSPMCQKDSFTMYVLESIPVGKYLL